MFKAGEKVIIKDWDEMEREFGSNSRGNINCAGCFTVHMRNLCGKTATIVFIEGKRYSPFTYAIKCTAVSPDVSRQSK